MTSARHILVIGATGFTGQQVLNQLAHTGHTVTALVRPGSTPPDWGGKTPLTIVRGDLNNPHDIEQALDGKDTLIFTASMGFDYMENVVAALKNSAVTRAVFTSSTAIFTALKAGSKDKRQKGEDLVKALDINWTVLRPTMIFGRKGDRNFERLVRYVRRWPVLFVPGSSENLIQPIFVDDVAKACVDVLEKEPTHKKAYNISGPAPLTFGEAVRTIATQMGTSIHLIHLPLKPMVWVVKMVEKILPTPPVKAEQLLRLNENKAFDHTGAQKDFNFIPTPFHDAINVLVKEVTYG